MTVPIIRKILVGAVLIVAALVYPAAASAGYTGVNASTTDVWSVDGRQCQLRLEASSANSLSTTRRFETYTSTACPASPLNGSAPWEASAYNELIEHFTPIGATPVRVRHVGGQCVAQWNCFVNRKWDLLNQPGQRYETYGSFSIKLPEAFASFDAGPYISCWKFWRAATFSDSGLSCSGQADWRAPLT